MTIFFVIGAVATGFDMLYCYIKKGHTENKNINFKLDKQLQTFAYLLLLLVFSQAVLDFVHYEKFNLFEIIYYAFKNFFHFVWIIYLAQNADRLFWKSYSPKQLILSSLVIASTLLSIYILLQSMGLGEVPTKHHFGVNSQPYTNSGVILAAIFSSLYFYRTKFLKNQYLALAIILVQILALFLLGQASACIGFLLGFLLINFKTRMISFKSLALIASVIIISLFFAAQKIPRLERKLSWFTSFEKLTKNKSMSCRYGIWQANFDQLKQGNWLFGNKKIKTYPCITKTRTNILNHAHNIYLQRLFTGGVFDLAIWLIFYLALFFFLIKTYSENYAFLAYFSALSVEGLFEYWWGDAEVKNIFLIVMFCLIVFYKKQASR